VIAPPRKASVSASFKPTRAASAVRTLARTEIFIPIYPVAPDRIAPTAKPPGGRPTETGTNPMTRNRITPTMPMVVYWRFRLGHGARLNGLRDLAHAVVAGGLLQDPGYFAKPP